MRLGELNFAMFAAPSTKPLPKPEAVPAPPVKVDTE
jgi:hypothetical protein